MSIFQKSVVNKYLKNLDELTLNQAYERFMKFYGNKLRLMNIVTLKEENYQEGFLREIFVNVLGYTISPDLNYNLTTEYKNQTDSKKADGAILKNGQAIGVIELKSTKTVFIESITNQAFNYKHNQPNCRYVITSNFHHLRFFIDNSTEFEEFDLFELTEKEFARFYLFLSKESIFNDIPLKLKEETKFHEENITDKFYRDYRQFKEKTFENLVKNNPVYDKLTLFKKSQKLLDRFIFVWFAEDCGLVAPNAIQKIIDQYNQYIKLDDYKTLFSRFQLLFQYLDKGYKSKTNKDIYWPPYNGGLFKYDEILDNSETKLDDTILLEFCPKISTYDFSTELDVNILGHIFEHSLNEIEEITAELKGEITEKSKTKRKKDGIFYTPKYITLYIIENTIGALCKEKKQTLKLQEIEINELYRKNDKITKLGKELYETLQFYKNWLFDLKILDPACGSGAFLNQALDYLINEHNQIDELIAELTGDKVRLFETDKTILERNIFGVDINEESVEIAKLSLWLRTAKKDRQLSDLNNNIKCGNSLIDISEIAGDKAFIWSKEFPEIMKSGGFDIIIANPPYVDNRGFDKPTLQFLYTNYPNSFEKSGTDKFKTTKLNLIAPFIELTGKILKNEGISGWIFHKNILKTNAYTSIRKYLLTNFDILNITDWGAGQFADVVAETATIAFRKSNTINDMISINFFKQNEQIETDTQSQNSYLTSYNNIFSIYKNGFDTNVIDIVEKCKTTLIDIINVNNGIVTGDDKKYISDVKLNNFYKPTLRGKDIKKYSILIPRQYVLYNKSELLRARDENIFLAPEKLIMQMINTDFVLTYDNQQFYNLGTTYAITNKSKYNLKTILAILNSKLITYYYKKKFTNNSSLTNAISTQNLFLIPFPEIIAETEIINSIDTIYELNNEILNLKSKLFNRIASNFDNVKINSKISEFNKLTFKLFQSELVKQNVKLSLNQQDEWEEYFKNNIKQINDKIQKYDNTLKTIDLLVYNLYGFTEKEINIVENYENVALK